MSQFFAVNDLVRVKMSVKSSRTIAPGEVATVTRLAIMGRAALYDLQLGDGTVATRVPAGVISGHTPGDRLAISMSRPDSLSSRTSSSPIPLILEGSPALWPDNLKMIQSLMERAVAIRS